MHILAGRERGGIATVVFLLLGHLSQSCLPVLFVLEEGWVSETARARRIRTEVIGASRFSLPTSLRRMLRLLGIEQAGIVHTHSVLAHLYGLVLKKLRRELFFVAHVHADIPRELASQGLRPLKRLLYDRGVTAALKASDVVIANSHAVRMDLANRGIPADKIKVVYNGVDTARIESEALQSERLPSCLTGFDGRPLVGTLGRLTTVKNQALLIRAAGYIVQDFPEVAFVVVGDGGSERKHLEELIHDLNLENHVVMTGWLDAPYPVLKRMDIVVLPSRWEGLGVTLLEAMVLQKPVVATRVGGIPEVVRDGETGLLVTPEDAQEMAGAIRDLLADPDRASAMGRSGRARVESKFSADEMARAVRSIYQSAPQRGELPCTAC